MYTRDYLFRVRQIKQLPQLFLIGRRLIVRIFASLDGNGAKHGDRAWVL